MFANYALLLAIFSRRRALDLSAVKQWPLVSIFKPISHPDDFLEENIETFFRLDYPNYEIIFGMDTADKECYDIVERARNKFPDVPSKVVSTLAPKLLNPKVATLMHMEPHSRGELYWITDSNIRVERDTLKRLVHEYAVNGSKLVFSPIRGTGSCTLGSIIENSQVNMFVSGNIIGAWRYFKKPVVVGKSMLIERKAMNSIGGFERFREYLAEDYMMGQIYREEGIALSTNYTWVTNYSSYSSLAQFYSRMERWAKLRFHMGLPAYLTEILMNPLAIALVAALALGPCGIHLLKAVFIAVVILEYIVLFAVNNNYWGIENLASIPSSVGASPVQNIGAYGTELKDIVESVEVVDLETGEKKILLNKDCEFGYRESVFKNKFKGKYFILTVVFKLNKKPNPNASYRALKDYLDKNNIQIEKSKDVSDAVSAIRVEKLPNPKVLGNAGSFFKNTYVDFVKLEEIKKDFPEVPFFQEGEKFKIPTGWLIEQCGWKGKRVGNVGVYEHQSLILVNHGGATGKEIFDLALMIIDSVYKRFGIKIDPEVNLI